MALATITLDIDKESYEHSLSMSTTGLTGFNFPIFLFSEMIEKIITYFFDSQTKRHSQNNEKQPQ